MKTRFFLSLLIAAILAAIPLRAALAHGEPVIAVEPAIAPAGGQITITGTEMEPGEVFAITLEGMAGSIALGEATATGEGEDADAGFSATFTIPADTAPGSYQVSAAAEDGDTTSADVTITVPSEGASAEPAMAQEPTGELHQIDRSKPIGQVIAVVVVIALSAAVGFVLIRNRG